MQVCMVIWDWLEIALSSAREKDAGAETIEGVRDGEIVDITVEFDDIDHLGNRRIRAVGELIQSQVRTGMSRMERQVRERMTTQDVEAITTALSNLRHAVAAAESAVSARRSSTEPDQVAAPGEESPTGAPSGRGDGESAEADRPGEGEPESPAQVGAPSDAEPSGPQNFAEPAQGPPS